MEQIYEERGMKKKDDLNYMDKPRSRRPPAKAGRNKNIRSCIRCGENEPHSVKFKNLKKCRAYGKNCEGCGKSGHFKKMCGFTNPHTALRFNKVIKKRNIFQINDEAEFRAIAEEVDNDNEEKIEADDTRRGMCKSYKKTFNPGYDSDDSASDSDGYRSDGRG